eukprot:gene8710-7926_t
MDANATKQLLGHIIMVQLRTAWPRLTTAMPRLALPYTAYRQVMSHSAYADRSTRRQSLRIPLCRNTTRLTGGFPDPDERLG